MTSRGYQRLESGDVQLTIQPDDYDRLLLVFGSAVIGALHQHPDSPLTIDKIQGLLNRLLAGNLYYQPYETSEKEHDHPYD